MNPAIEINAPAENEMPWPYKLPRRALLKWARENVTFESGADGSIVACFHFLGTTCSNLGHPIKLLFWFTLSPARDGERTIVASSCRPAPDDTGCPRMCSALESPESFQIMLECYAPLTGKTFSEALAWNPDSNAAGCLCHRTSQNHKWCNGIQAVHYALTLRDAAHSHGLIEL